MTPELEEKLRLLEEQITLQNYVRAIRKAEGLIESEEPEYQILGTFYKSIALSHLQKEQEAIELLNQAIPTFDKPVNLFEARYEIRCKIGQFIEAKEDALKLIELEETNEDHKFKLIEILENFNDYSSIIDVCDKLLNKFPNDFDILEAKVSALMGQNELAIAKEILIHMQTLTEDEADIGWVYCNLGQTFSNLGDYQQAEMYLNKALELMPTSSYVFNNLGFTMAQTGRIKEGLNFITKAIKLDSRNSYAYKDRAKVFLQLGKPRKARKDLLRAVELGYEVDYDDEVEKLLQQIS